MNTLVVLTAIVACVVADVSHLDPAAPIVKSSYELTPNGDFTYEYETGNGIAAQVQGVVTKPTGSEYPAVEFRGGYRYTAPDGTPVVVSYVANENGFQPTGNVIPTSPPIPELIARSIAYIAANPPKDYVSPAVPSPYRTVVG